MTKKTYKMTRQYFFFKSCATDHRLNWIFKHFGSQLWTEMKLTCFLHFPLLLSHGLHPRLGQCAQSLTFVNTWLIWSMWRQIGNTELLKLWTFLLHMLISPRRSHQMKWPKPCQCWGDVWAQWGRRVGNGWGREFLKGRRRLSERPEKIVLIRVCTANALLPHLVSSS